MGAAAYPWAQLRQRASFIDSFFLDGADYEGPVKLSSTDDGPRRRCLIATSTIEPGEIFLIGKAEVSAFVDPTATCLTLGLDMINDPPVFPDTLALSHAATRLKRVSGAMVGETEGEYELSSSYAGPA